MEGDQLSVALCEAKLAVNKTLLLPLRLGEAHGVGDTEDEREARADSEAEPQAEASALVVAALLTLAD